MGRWADSRTRPTRRPLLLRALLPITSAVTLVCSFAFIGVALPPAGADAPLAASPGSLTLEMSSETTAPGSSVTVRVANAGEGLVTSVELRASAPAGVVASLTPEVMPDLPPQTSMLVVVSLSGVPTTSLRRLEVTATGATEAGRTAAVAAVEISPFESAVTMSITGNTRLTDASPADLTLVVRNGGDEQVAVTLRGTAGQHDLRLGLEGEDLSQSDLGDRLDLELPGRSSALVQARVEASGPMRRGSTALIVTADVTAPDVEYDVNVSQSLDTTLSTDVLPSIVGIGSLLFIPGLVAVGVWLAVRAREERRRGLIPQSPVSAVLDNKMWLFVAAVISAVAAVVSSRLGFTNVFDTYALSDILVLGALCGVLGLVVAKVAVKVESRGVPTLDEPTSAIVTLTEASRFSGLNARSVYKTPDGKLGLLVKTLSDDALVLSPRCGSRRWTRSQTR